MEWSTSRAVLVAGPFAIRLGRTGDLTGSDAIAWSYHKSTPYVPSLLLYKGKLYVLSNNNGVLTVFDSQTGKILIDAERLEAIPGVYSSPVAANGRIYLLGPNWRLRRVQGLDKLEVLATNRLDEKIDASPALASNLSIFSCAAMNSSIACPGRINLIRTPHV